MTRTFTQIRKARLRAILKAGYGLPPLSGDKRKRKIQRGWIKVIAKSLFHLGEERGAWGEKR